MTLIPWPLRLSLFLLVSGLGACPTSTAKEGEGEGPPGKGEGEGEGEGEVSAFAGLLINEVGCDGGAAGAPDFVELIHTGTGSLLLEGAVLSDDPGNLAQRMNLSGTLDSGALLSLSPTFGLRCSDTLSLLRVDGSVVDVVTLPGRANLPTAASSSWGRLPDGSGPFDFNAPTPGAPNQAFVDVSDALFQPFQNPLRIDLTLSAAAEASLRSPATEFAYVEAAFAVSGNGINDAPIALVGLRKKGKVGSSRSFDQKLAWKLDFDRFVPGQKYRRLSKINLNNMVQDPSTIHEYMAYTVLGHAGLPTPRMGAATVFVNNVEFGTYLMLEAFDDDLYLERGFSDTVALFEGGLTEAACCDFADIQPDEIGRFEHDAGDEEVGRGALVEFSTRLSSSPAADLFTALDPIVDWDQILTTMAVESVIGHWDGYQVSPNNYYLHLSADQKWRLMASGVDQTFGNEGRVDVVFNGNGNLFRRCRENATCAALYHQKLAEAVDRGAALLASNFEADVDTLIQHHLATFSRARLEASLDDGPARANAAFAYLNERLFILRQALACDGLNRGDACSVDVGGAAESHRCGNFSGGLGCVD